MQTEPPPTLPPSVSLEAKVAFLSGPDAYAERPARVEVVQTHMSWVFMTDRRVYKLKKPVRHPFLDFSTLKARRDDCLEEVRLNRRLAPDVYLGVVLLTRRNDGPALVLGGSGEPVEWLVEMRRLPGALMLDHAIVAGSVSEHDVERIARTLAAFYASAASERIDADEYRQWFERDVARNHAILSAPEYGLSCASLDRITAAQRAFIASGARLLERRAEAGRIIEAHGDLRPEHVCLSDPPAFIDCLEFNRSFRILDPVDELAYLAMECEFLGAGFIGERVFAVYCAQTGDRPDARLVDFYKSYRAVLRARLAVWHLDDHDDRDRWIARALRYLDLAGRHACAF
jgi:aminoglycoside phosphotransferase family enzyme